MNDAIIVDGVRYISTAEAARLVRLSRDYIARFCREEQVRAKQVGSNWYVDPNSLASYVVSREEAERERKAQLSADLRRAAEQHATTQRARAEQFATARIARRASKRVAILLALLILVAGLAYGNRSALAYALSSLRSLATGTQLSNLASAAAPLDSNSPTAQQTATSTTSQATSPTPSSPAIPTVVYQTINQPVAERTVVQPASDQPLAAKFDSLLGVVGLLTKLVPSFALAQPDPVSQQIAANGNAAAPFAAQSAVSQLANTNISAPAITGGSISNASFSGGSVSASSLAVSGNTSLSGTLTVGGALTAGALTFSAASTTGIITMNATETNAVITNATSTNLFASLGTFTSAIANSLSAAAADITDLTAANLVATNATTTNATSTNLYAQNVTIGQLAATDASLANLSATNATTSLLFVKSALSSPSATIGALTATTSLAVSGPASFTTASTSLFSSYGPAYFGATATSSFDSAGDLRVAGNTTLQSATSSSFAITSIPWGLLATDGSGNIAATSSPTALSFTATSATATSTFAGGLTAGGANGLTVLQNGNVGIGTTSAPFALTTIGDAEFYGPNEEIAFGSNSVPNDWSLQAVDADGRFRIFGGGNERLTITQSGNVGIGQTNPGALLQIGGASGNYNNIADRTNGITFGGNSNPGYINARFDAAWDIGRDTTSGGIMNFWSDNGSTNVAAGTISVNGSTASYNTTSDRRLKTDIATSTEGLSTLLQIPVYNFAFKSDPTKTIQQGFIAQALYPIYPEAVTTNGDNGLVPLSPTSTPWEVDYGRITPLIVKAVQDIANLSDTFKNTLIAWLANAQNGITDLFAKNLHAENELCVGKSGGGEVCVTGDQLAALLSQSAPASLPKSVTSSAPQNSSAPLPESVTSATPSVTKSVSSATSTTATDTTDSTNSPQAPQIQINGNNPAIIQVGSIYSDLGATITGPAQDLNLGIRTFVDGTPMSPVLIDTSAAATDTIQYVVADSSGLTSTSTRTVIVQAAPNQVATPANDNSPAATSTPSADVQSATSSPVNDNTASTTSATTAAAVVQ